MARSVYVAGVEGFTGKSAVALGVLEQLAHLPPDGLLQLDGWTWEMFTTAARQASRGPASGVYIEPSLEAITPFVWSAGGEIVDDVQAPTTLTLSDGDSREALEQVLALVRDPQVTPTGSELDEQDAVSRFAEGKLGMILGTRELTPDLRAAEDLRFDVMPLPRLGPQRTVSEMMRRSGETISSLVPSIRAISAFTNSVPTSSPTTYCSLLLRTD